MEFHFYLFKDFNNTLSFWKDIIIITGTIVSTISILCSLNKWKKQEKWKLNRETILELTSKMISINRSLKDIQVDLSSRVYNDDDTRDFQFREILKSFKENESHLNFEIEIDKLKALNIILESQSMKEVANITEKFINKLHNISLIDINKLRAGHTDEEYENFIFHFNSKGEFIKSLDKIVEVEINDEFKKLIK